MRLFFRIPTSIFHSSTNVSTWSRWKFAVFFLPLWLLHEKIRDAPSEAPQNDSIIALGLLVVEAIKFLLAITYYFWRRTLEAHTDDSEEDQPLNSFHEPREAWTPDSPSPRPNGHSWHSPNSHNTLPRIPRILSITFVVLASVSFSYRNYNSSLTVLLTDPFTLYLTFSIATFFIFLASFILLSWTFDIVQWQAALMQFGGFFIMQAGLITRTLPSPSYPILLGLVFSTSAAFTIINYVYTRQHAISLEALHVMLFSVPFLIHLAVLATQRPSLPALQTHVKTFTFPVFAQCLLQSILDLLSLAVVYYHDAATVGVFISFGSALYLLLLSLFTGVHTVNLLAGCSLVLVGSIIYITHKRDNREDKWHLPRNAYILLQIIASVLASTLAGYLMVTTHWEIVNLQYNTTKPLSAVEIIADSKITCRRKPLQSTSFYLHERTYHAFDNVLLIVFFSHARYDANLDYYRDVYSEFFPNIVFVGPGSREDAGFDHSYDVLVDSYESEEDLSDPSFYKMAGRMAHHMLYTAMREHDCYDGYLWAPFDTLLNVPRLQQFDQQFFWYHSPFGQYVYNPALGDPIVNSNKSMHPPPANISPDPAINLTATWRGWGPDWWWGEPHVGLEVCIRAFMNVPLHMREHLATLTNHTTRLIGGSADTLYIPGRHRQVFMNTLATFLETDCFLEIATPTVVHLVSPPGEPILYVDHWWIWQPPFNATFVRQKWAEGLEVDTFHTFHWGDKGADGVWRGNPDHIHDVRRLLDESALRQEVDFPLRSPGVTVRGR